MPHSTPGSAPKRQRQTAILGLVGARRIGSQDELKHLLSAEGWHVTQATLSRDLRELGILRASTDDGPRYVLPEMVAEDVKPSLDNLLPQLFSRLDGVGELIVLHTLPGGAQPIAEAVDAEGWPEVAGTLGGENTILVICRSAQARAAVSERLVKLARG